MDKKNCKKFYLKFLLWVLLIPLVSVSIFTVAFSIFELNYYYLPYSLDFLIQWSYNISYYLYAASIFFTCGVVGYVILTGKYSDKIIGIVTGTLSIIIIPAVNYLIKYLFLSDSLRTEDMYELFISDVYALVEDGVKYLIFLIAVSIIAIYYHVKKIKYKLEKPYFSPIGPFQLIVIIFYSAWFFGSLIIFMSQNSSDRNITNLIVELIYSIAGYFLTITGCMIFSKNKDKNA